MGTAHDVAAVFAKDIFEMLRIQGHYEPRVALVAFGRISTPEIHVINDFTVDYHTVQEGLYSIIAYGGYEEGFKALLDVFQPESSALHLSFREDAPVCAIIFSDESSDGETTAEDVVNAKQGSTVKVVIPVVTAGEAQDDYSLVSDLSNPSTFAMEDFLKDPAPTLKNIVAKCFELIPPEPKPHNCGKTRRRLIDMPLLLTAVVVSMCIALILFAPLPWKIRNQAEAGTPPIEKSISLTELRR